MTGGKNYDCAKHGRKSEISFGIIDDDNQRRCHNIAEGAEPDQAGNADDDRHKGRCPTDSRVDVQGSPYTAPMIHATLYIVRC